MTNENQNQIEKDRELLEKISKLSPRKRTDLFIELLDEGIISVSDLLVAYTTLLKYRATLSALNISGLSSALSYYVEHAKLNKKKQDRFHRAKALYHLKVSGHFEGSTLGEEIVKELNNINYYEDEYGIPKYEE